LDREFRELKEAKIQLELELDYEKSDKENVMRKLDTQT
jgi:hypothetical protein